MSRLADVFARERARGSRALVCYLVAGDPDLESSRRLAERVIKGGADVVELGLPFSDPIADGPVLQAAAMRALGGGMTISRALEFAASLSPLGAPLVGMGYYNPLLAFGLDRFAERAAAAGLAGVIVPDLPHEEARPLHDALAAHGLDLVPLVAPTTSPDRMRAVAEAARGFVYYVSVAGVTGARAGLPTDLAARLADLRSAAKVPVAVGFGVSTPEHARAIARLADGVVVGSALVKLWHETGSLDAVEAFVRGLKLALSGD